MTKQNVAYTYNGILFSLKKGSKFWGGRVKMVAWEDVEFKSPHN